MSDPIPFQQFADDAAWENVGAGTLKRKPLDDLPSLFVEINQIGKQYQTTVHLLPKFHRQRGPFDTLAEAKTRAYEDYTDCLREETKRDDQHPPAREDMSL